MVTMNRQSLNFSVDVLVVGGGPAGLIAATELSKYDCKICVIDSMPTVGRKFLMAGKSGLNITTSKSEFLKEYCESEQWITPIIKKFGPEEIMNFCQSLGQKVVFGSSGKVFPESMKTSPLLRTWLAYLKMSGVIFKTSSRWVDFSCSEAFLRSGNLSNVVQFNLENYFINSRATLLALGGASWPRLGSDGKWYSILQQYLDNRKISLVPFRAANMGVNICWSSQMMKFEGKPVKQIAIKVNGKSKKGEFVVTSSGFEGGVIYKFSTMQSGKLDSFELDLLPDVPLFEVCRKLSGSRRKLTMTNFLRKSLGLTGVKFGLLREFGYPFPNSSIELAKIIKNLHVKIDGTYSIEQAISTKGGVGKEAVNSNLMLNDLPGVFCAGEMLDWTAPTGGYLLTGCFSTGSHAGKSVAKYLNLKLLS